MPELRYKNKKKMFELVFPILIEQLLNATIGIADTVMVSSTGDNGVSGVTNVDVINTLLFQVFAAVATGATVVVAQCIGAGDKDKAARTAKQAVKLVLFVSVIIGTLLAVFARPVLTMIYGIEKPGIMDYAVPYFIFSAASYPFMAVFTTCSGIMRAQGKSLPPMTAAFIMNIVNVGGNAFFIYVCGMETAGAALASMIARIVAASITVFMLMSPKRSVNLRGFLFCRFESSILKAILFISIPTAVENALFNLGKIISQSFVNGYEPYQIAANSVSNNVLTITLIAAYTMNLSVTTVVGYCVGSGYIKESRDYILKFMGATAVFMTALNLIIYPCLDVLLTFYKVSPEAIGTSKMIIITMLVASPFLHPLSFNVCHGLRAAGDVKFTMIVAIISMFLVRVAMGYVLGTVFGLGTLGNWIAMYLDWVVRASFFVPRIFSKKRKIKNLVKE